MSPVPPASRRPTLRPEHQAALRRVATLVLEGATASELFTLVVEEVVAVLDVPAAWLFRSAPDRSLTVLASLNDPGFPVGSRWPVADASPLATLLATAQPARIDAYPQLGETLPAVSCEPAHGPALGVPITVDGVVWGGLIGVLTTEREPVPSDTEAGLRDFTELVATAISKAQANDDLRRLVREKAGLTRVATIVAEGAPTAELFAVLTQEVVQALEVPSVSLVRYEADRSTVVLASLNAPELPVGRRLPLDDHSLTARVLETGRPARDRSELRAEVGVPIVVDGEVWGLVRAASTGPEPLRADVEASLRDFTELVATAISRTESRESLRRVVAEQAALRNVATLVAEGAAPAEVFSSVAQQVARVLDVSAVSIVRFESDTWSVAVASFNDPLVTVGGRWPLEGPSLDATVFRTGKPAQIDAAGPGVRVGVPIVVEGRVWGMIAVGQRRGRDALPAFAGSYSGRIVLSTASPRETQARLGAFTELVATAISKAQAHDDLSALAMEQAALRRVATLVARDAPSAEVFEVVATEVGRLLDTEMTVIGRYDGDGASTAIGSWSASPGGMPVGTRTVLGGRNATTLVAQTGSPARVDGYDDATGEAAEFARRHGWRSSIAAPISVEGRLWGVMLVSTQRPEPFPAGAETRLAAFTDLVATALANAQAHDEVRWFGEEQAALGRVATLVAAGAAPEQVFTAVVEEASRLVALERIELVRLNSDNTGTVIAASGEHPLPARSPWSFGDHGPLRDEINRRARSAGFQSGIGAPLTVEGSLWGVIIAVSTETEPISERSEARLRQFTGLVATAVANAEARQALERVAAEQATLHRIAALVARGVQPEEVFAAVVEETSATFGALTTLTRFEHDPPGAVLVAASNETGLPIGMRWELAGGMIAAEVYRTGRPSRLRVDEGYWSSRGGPVGEMGARLGLVSRVSCPILVEGVVWGAIAVNGREEQPADTEQRLEKFTGLVSTAIANAEGKSELAASRRRIVAAGDEARRRIERDLHDGIQQRLIALGYRAREMMSRPPEELPGLAAELLEGLNDVSDELQEVSRGIHPTILTRAGLGPALRALARRSNVPTEVDVSLDRRLPAPVEAAAYYIASEALTNVEKHAQASAVAVTVVDDDGTLRLVVRDDGIGGADSGGGSGILGLTDRVEALGGRFALESPPGSGTTISVELPTATPGTP